MSLFNELLNYIKLLYLRGRAFYIFVRLLIIYFLEMVYQIWQIVYCVRYSDIAIG